MAVRAFLLLFLAVAADARWLRLSSPHFEFYTNESEGRARGLLRRLEQLHHAFRAVPIRPVHIVAFRTGAEFHHYKPFGEAAGFYSSGIARDYILLDLTAADVQRVLTHEFVHLLNYGEDPFMPLWRNEGLAEFYSTARVQGDTVVVGGPILEHLRTLQTSPLLSYGELLKLDRQSGFYNEANRRNVFYAQSWALVHMQFFEPAGKDIDAQLRRYVTRADYGTRVIAVPRAASTPDIAVAALDDLEADLMLIDLASAVGKQDWADAQVERLGRRRPDHPLVQAQAADLLARRGDQAGAKAAYARALAKSSSGRLRFEYALFLRGIKAPDAEVRAALEEAVNLEPEFADARAWLESMRRQAPLVKPPRSLATAQPGRPQLEGTLTQVDCLDARARLHVVSGGQKHLLLVEGAVAEVAIELPCGPMPAPRAVWIEFDPVQDAVYRTTGRVVRLKVP